jgi:hypothetical protein
MPLLQVTENEERSCLWKKGTCSLAYIRCSFPNTFQKDLKAKYMKIRHLNFWHSVSNRVGNRIEYRRLPVITKTSELWTVRSKKRHGPESAYFF